MLDQDKVKTLEPADMQREKFIAWMKRQPQRNDPQKLYSDIVVKTAANKLQFGLKSLGIPEYADVNCFTITDSETIFKLHAACYQAATVSDKDSGYKAFRNGLDFYLQFLLESEGKGVTAKMDVVDPIIEKIHLAINSYKKNFAFVNEQERYKWEAIAWYQQHWKIDAEDFAQMLETAFSKASNLLASAMYYPYKMIVLFAKDDPEEVRRIFKVLHNEEIPLVERYRIFQSSCKSGIDKIMKQHPERTKALQHYQDLRAVMVYLTFQYPEKYYLYKFRMFTDFCDRVGFTEDKPKHATALWKVESYTRLCEIVRSEVKRDSELIQMSQARLDNNCYKDEALHLLTVDIVFHGSNMDKEVFNPVASDGYWPSIEEYDPGISKEMWLAALRDPSVTTSENLDMLRKILELGGESTCAHLAEIYGRTHSYYNKLGSSYGEKVKKRYHCPDCIDREEDTSERNRVYVIPFIGRYVMEDGNRRYSWKLRKELKEALEELSTNGLEKTEEPMTDVGLNTILYGPPGTGKTYHTVIYAVAIIENKKLAVVEKEDYADVLERYNTYRDQGLIEFTTFHQSYGYEEFIEGIKPVPPDDSGDSSEIQYSVQSGIFKQFCERAEQPASTVVTDYGFNSNPTVWKVSLDGTGENATRSECLSNGHIRLGWDDYGKDITDETAYSSGGKKILSAFINRMQVGDIVLSCYSASTIDAIGVVTGEYEWHDEYPRMKRLRKVNWIVKNIRENILTINGGTTMTLSSVYRMNISLSDIYQIIEKYQPRQEMQEQTREQNYVFIIDEINRGNVSKILGELITLIEPSKRVGQPEGMTARLPYSAKTFGVPKNVYIIGTMNTADRSIATIDTALRRRFLFREMLPNPAVLRDVSVEDLSIEELLVRINKRITVLYDREHTIGHAYFMPLKDSPTIETLAEIFSNNIIPLLQEYFYEDYEKIRLVLGDNQKEAQAYQFITAKKNNYADLFGSADVELDDGFSYEINYGALQSIETYRSI